MHFSGYCLGIRAPLYWQLAALPFDCQKQCLYADAGTTYLDMMSYGCAVDPQQLASTLLW